MSGWQPISTYPRDEDDWGPDVIVLMPAIGVEMGGRYFTVPPYELVAHMEGGMWLARDPSDPVCWDDLIDEPTHWQPIDRTVAQPAASTDAP